MDGGSRGAFRGWGSRGGQRGGRGASFRGRGASRGRGGFVYVKKSEQRSEHVHSLKLNYWKKVLPAFRAEQDNESGEIEQTAQSAGTKRRREQVGAANDSTADTVTDSMSMGCDNADSLALARASQALRSPSSLRGRGGNARGERPRDSHMFSKPNRFSGALARANATAEEAERLAAAAAEKKLLLEKRLAERVEVARRYAQRTGRGQPIMRHRLHDMLGRIERQGQRAEQVEK